MFWRQVEYIFCKLGCDLPWLQVRNQLQRVVLEEISQERDQLCPHQGYFRKVGSMSIINLVADMFGLIKEFSDAGDEV